MPISKELLEILVCPETKAPLVLDGETLVSTDPKTRRRYKIKDDIPVMLIDESEILDEAEWKAILDKHGAKPCEGQSSASKRTAVGADLCVRPYSRNVLSRPMCPPLQPQRPFPAYVPAPTAATSFPGACVRPYSRRSSLRAKPPLRARAYPPPFPTRATTQGRPCRPGQPTPTQARARWGRTSYGPPGAGLFGVSGFPPRARLRPLRPA